jgi:hypothetical protein
LDSRVTEFGYWPGPDRQNDIDIGIQWLRSLTDPDVIQQVRRLIKNGEEGVYRGTYFLARTFLYYASSDQLEIPFTPDTTREPLLSKILAHEELLRERILSALKSSYENFPVHGERRLRRQIPPFAAYVFRQASLHEGSTFAKRRNILREMHRLRHEIAPVRNALRSTEEGALRRSSRDELIKSEGAWFDAIASIKKEFGHSPEVVTVKRGLGFGSNILSTLITPWNPAAWASLLSGAGFEMAQDIMSRGPVIAIHKLRSQLPGPAELRQALNKLFPEGLY